MIELNELLDTVSDKKSFLIFSKALMDNRKSHKGKTVNDVGFADGWANNDIWGFLESAVAWAEDSDFGENQDSELKDNPWKQFAVFLYCGKIYE